MKTGHLIFLGLGGYLAYRWWKQRPIGPFDWRRYDFNNNGIIDPNEMDSAIYDQRAGIITYEQLKEVGSHRGPPV